MLRAELASARGLREGAALVDAELARLMRKMAAIRLAAKGGAPMPQVTNCVAEDLTKQVAEAEARALREEMATLKRR